MLSGELRLRHQLASFQRWRVDASAAQTQVNRLIAEQNEVRGEYDRLISRREKLQNSPPPNLNQDQIDDRVGKMTERIDELGNQIASPAELAGRATMRKELIRMLSACNRIILLRFTAGMRLRRLTPEYERLALDPAVTASLEVLEARELLGGGSDYANEQERLLKIARQVMIPRWPVYGQNGKWRTSVILEEQHPTTVTIFEDTPERPYPAWLPASVLEAAGIKIPADAAHLHLTLPGGRQVPTRVIRLAYLRFGGHRLGGIEVLALSPEDEDLGGQISLELLKKHGLSLDTDQLPAILRK